MKQNKDIIRLFKEFSIANPYDSTQTYLFKNVEELAKLLFDIIELDINEPTLDGLSQKLLPSFQFFADESFDFGEASKKIEALSTGFESFLKKIAVLKYKGDTVRLYGDGTQYIGILDTSLGKLLEGEVGKHRGSRAPKLYAPIVSFTYAKDNVREGIYEKVRGIRNEVHISPLRSIWEALDLFKILLAAYLFAIEENLKLIKEEVNKLYIYAIKTKEYLKNLELRYVELDTTMRTYSLEETPELFAFEWQDELESDPYAFNPEDPGLPKDTPLNESVVNIIRNHNRLWLIGEPGAGKTTSLQKVAHVACNRLLSCAENSPCPVFMVAAQLDNRNSLINVVAMKLEVSESDVREFLEEGKLLLLIDGINEVSEDYQANVFRQIKSLLDEYPSAYFVLSSRKHAFRDVFKIPVYELMPLTDDQILIYLKQNMEKESRIVRLYNDLMSSDGKIIDLARNPLMLCMITKVTTNEGLPKNRGMLFRQFSKWILSRERTNSQFSIETKEYILASLAFLVRTRDTLYLDKTIVFEYIRSLFMQMNLTYDIFKFYEELLKNGLLSVDNNNRVLFSHELFLEYYSAEYLLKLYVKGEFDIKKYKLKSKWEQPIIILTGMLPDSNKLIQRLFGTKHITLAARCLASGAIVEQDTMKRFLSILEKKLNSKQQKVKACVALLELGTEDSLRILVKYSGVIDRIFEWAIRETERPEMASLKLLKFGHTGLKRIKSCMRVISRSANLKMLRDTEDVAKAQIEILKNAPESVDISMIAKMGISQRCLPEAKILITEILQHERVDTSRWRACVALAISSWPETNDLIFKRISNIESASGELEFSIFITCVKNKIEKSLEMARKRVDKCLDGGLPILAIKYIKTFKLEEDYPFTIVEKYIKDCACKGKIGVMSAWEKLYSEENLRPYLKDVIKVQLQRGNLDAIIQHGDLVRESLDEFLCLIKQSVFSSSCNSYKRKRKFTRKIATLLENEEIFKNKGIITSCNAEKRYGFIAHPVKDENYFFHFSSIEQKDIVPAIGQFVSFDYDKVITTGRLPKIRKLKILG